MRHYQTGGNRTAWSSLKDEDVPALDDTIEDDEMRDYSETMTQGIKTIIYLIHLMSFDKMSSEEGSSHTRHLCNMYHLMTSVTRRQCVTFVITESSRQWQCS